MKKLLIVAFALTLFTSINAQSFDGVEVRGTLSTIVPKYKAKGYVVRSLKDEYCVMDGYVAGKAVELFIYVTPITKVVFKVNVYLPKRENWITLKNEYVEYVNILKQKYGEWDNTYYSFNDPYYDGDGYEMSAVQLDKVNFFTVWLNRSGANYAVQITKFKQVMITYENDANVTIGQNERDRLNNKSF